MEQEEVWDAIAEKWSEFRVKPTEEVVQFLSSTHKGVSPKIGTKVPSSSGKNGRVLDLGCGSGRHGPPRDSDGLDFYGVDFSEKLLGLAKGKGYVELKKGVTWDIPYGDGFFDYVLFVRVLHCVETAEKRRKSLGEVIRVLKVGGEALITSWGRGSERLKNHEKEGFLPWTVGEVKVERYTYIYEMSELKAELEDAGFEILKGWEDENVCFVVRKR